jgi:hypothetical protein
MRRITYRLGLGILLLVALLMLWANDAHAQAAYNMDRDSGKILTSGGTFTHNNRLGSLNLTFELLLNGSPTSSTVTIQGCGRGNLAAYGSSNGLNGLPTNSPVCDLLDTYSGNASANRKITGLYDAYVVTGTWSGGTSPTLQVNILETAASSPAVLGGFAFTQITANQNTQIKAVSATLHTIVIGAVGSGETLTLVDTTASNCSGGSTIGVITPVAGQTLVFDITTQLGLCITTAGTTAGNYTVTWK